jgi:hypothetical protein
MPERLMLLPSNDPSRIRLVTMPEDLGPQEAYRMVTGLAAEVEETTGAEGLADILETLEARGFGPVEFVLGPTLD